MKLQLSVFNRDMVDGTGSPTHTAGDSGTFKSRTGSRRTGVELVSFSEDEFTVGSDVQYKSQ